MSGIRCTYPKIRSLLPTPYAPNSNGVITVYNNKTSKQSTVYSNPTKASLTNPVALDSSGLANMFVEGDSSYTFSFTDSASAPIKTIDDVVEYLEPKTDILGFDKTLNFSGTALVLSLDPMPDRVKTAKIFARVTSAFAFNTISIGFTTVAYGTLPTIEVRLEGTSTTEYTFITYRIPVSAGDILSINVGQTTGVAHDYRVTGQIEYIYED